MRKVKKTKHYSYSVGNLAKGCRLCVQGKKEVIFITGLCSTYCYYCPISDQKKGHDVVYANERPVEKLKEIITEAKLCSSEGAGITGGDPLVTLRKTARVIKMLKKAFGKGFHIHLYTPLNRLTEEALRKLERAGLDEIRLHPRIGDKRLWLKILYPTAMSKGVEIPVIPGKEKEAKELINFIDGKVGFLNLNELEISDAKASKLFEKGFRTKSQFSYGIKGSEELAKRLLKHCEKNTSLNVHYCTARLKDRVQLANRIKRRAKNVAKDYDVISGEGSLIRGAIYIKEVLPTFHYKERIERANKPLVLKKLNSIRRKLMKDYKIPKSLIEVDKLKLRLLTTVGVVDELKKDLKKLKLNPAIAEELPTYDQFEIENMPL